MSSGNVYDLKHNCIRHSLPTNNQIGDVRLCGECGRAWWVPSWGLLPLRRWTPVRRWHRRAVRVADDLRGTS